jgi:hypothetical protein
VELRDFLQPFMGGNFTFRRIVQDAFDPVALSDVVPSLSSCSGKLARRHRRKRHHRDRVSPTVIAKALGIGLASVYRVLEAGR